MAKKKGYVTTTQIEKRFNVIRAFLAVVISILFCFLLILICSDNAINDILTFITAPLTTQGRFYQLLIRMSPVLFSSLAVCVLFSANTTNLAVEGAFYAGALASSMISTIDGFLPAPWHFIVAAIFGAIGASIVLLIPSVLKLKFNADIVVCSLMLNYIVNWFGNYLICGPWRDPSCATEATAPIASTAKLTIFLKGGGQKVHTGILIAIGLSVITWFILYKTNFGYQSRTAGQNNNFAKFSGINVGKIVILGSIIAGCLCGIGATAEINGVYRRMEWDKSIGYGWDGIMIACLAGNNPLLCIPAAAFLAYVRTAADILNMSSSIPTEIVNIVQQVVIIMIAAKNLLAKSEKKAIIENAKKQNDLQTKEAE